MCLFVVEVGFGLMVEFVGCYVFDFEEVVVEVGYVVEVDLIVDVGY